jgi:alcohol-forming fatty acyl-CoA reductase
MTEVNSNSNKFQNVSISQFYSGKSIFITGGTGFVGKLLIEKILRSCPEVGNIYILIRPKKDKNVTERINELIETLVFEKIKEKSPEVLKKIIPISGDIILKELGISKENRQILIDNVSVVFHSAANLKFNDNFKICVPANIEATKDMVKLCRDIKGLKVDKISN